MARLQIVKKHGRRAKGRTERIKYLEGQHLTRDQAIKAHCYDCTGWYADGARSCGSETCSLCGYHPYRKGVK